MQDELYQLEVTDRQSFIRFLHLLYEDYLLHKDNWENADLGSFLEAMTAYAKDVDGYYMNTGQDIDADTPTWKIFSDILLGAKIYE